MAARAFGVKSRAFAKHAKRVQANRSNKVRALKRYHYRGHVAFGDFVHEVGRSVRDGVLVATMPKPDATTLGRVVKVDGPMVLVDPTALPPQTPEERMRAFAEA